MALVMMPVRSQPPCGRAVGGGVLAALAQKIPSDGIGTVWCAVAAKVEVVASCRRAPDDEVENVGAHRGADQRGGSPKDRGRDRTRGFAHPRWTKHEDRVFEVGRKRPAVGRPQLYGHQSPLP